MRGSTYYQTAQLTKSIFIEKAKKEEKTDINHENYNCVSSFKTMETYRSVWNNFFNYLREQFNLKNCELITEEHIKSYFEYKIEYYCSKQYAEKISSALGKLEFALNIYSKEKYKDTNKKPIVYNFKIRQDILNHSRDFELVANNYKNRTYQKPKIIIDNMQDEKHKIAAMIQLTGGARVEAVKLIKIEQLKGIKTDHLIQKEVGIITTKEKGGKIGDVLINIDIYKKLEEYLFKYSSFKISYQNYLKDLKEACNITKQKYHSSHGMRWTFAQERVRKYQQHGHYSYYEAIQKVSWEMKHFRASITEHYLN